MPDSPPRSGFSLKALLLAPWPVPLLASAVFALSMPGGNGPAVFLIFSALGLVVSGLGTLALAATLWVVAQFRPVTKTLSAAIGFALAAAGYVAFAWVNWLSSGPDSGPPDQSFVSFLGNDGFGFFLGVFVFGGPLTALLYHAIAAPPGSGPPAPLSPPGAP
jgi:hypothetical protein